MSPSTKKQEFLAVYLDLGAAELAVKYLVADFDIKSDVIAILTGLASPTARTSPR